MKFQESSPVLSIPDIILLTKAAAGKSGQERENELYSLLKTWIFLGGAGQYERQQKDFLKFISIFAYNIMVSFLVHSEPIGQYIHKTPPCISLENHIRFQTKVYNRFQTKTAQKPYQFLSKGQ